MPNQEKNQRGLAQKLLKSFNHQQTASAPRRPNRDRHQQSVGSAVEPGRPLSKDERLARHDSVQEESGYKPDHLDRHASAGSAVALPRGYDDTSFRDVFGKQCSAIMKKMSSRRGSTTQALLDEAQAVEDCLRTMLDPLPDVSPILALQITFSTRISRIVSGITTFTLFFLLVFGSLWALVQSLLTNTRAEATCTHTTVYVPYTTTVTALSASLASPELVSGANDGSFSATTTRTTTVVETDTNTVFVTPNAQPVSVLSSSGGATYFWQEVAGTTSWINGISPPVTESLTYGTTTLFVNPVGPTTPQIDSTTTVQTTSTRFGTTTITITPPVSTSTIYSMESAISTSTLYMTMTETIQVSQVSTDPRQSFSGIGNSGWNVTSVSFAPVQATGDVGPATSEVPATVTGTFYFGTGDLTTSTSTGLLTTTLTSRITQTNLITATISTFATEDASSEPAASVVDPVGTAVSSTSLPPPPAANSTLSLPPANSSLVAPQSPSVSSTILSSSDGIISSISASEIAPATTEIASAVPSSAVSSLSVMPSPLPPVADSSSSDVFSPSSDSTPASGVATNLITETSITGSVTILPIFASTNTVTVLSNSINLSESTVTGFTSAAPTLSSSESAATTDFPAETASVEATSSSSSSLPPPLSDTSAVAEQKSSFLGGVGGLTSDSSAVPSTVSNAASSPSAETTSSLLEPSSTSASPTTSTTSATASPATATPTICGTDNGDFTLDWDDLGTFTPTDPDTNITQAPPVRQPYHHLAFSNGYVYSPAPEEPFVPRSEPHLLVFLANETADPSTGAGGSIRHGEIGGARSDDDPAFWFNAYRAWLGCDNAGPDDCTLVMTAYGWDGASQAEQTVGTTNVTLAPCETMANCQLQSVEFPSGWDNLSGLQIRAFVENEERMFFMDDLDMGWSNNTCEAGLARMRGSRGHGGSGGLRMFKW
ncbi:hypothetical protein MBLNU230_g7129t1 [Neophaeotheca triangularis]